MIVLYTNVALWTDSKNKPHSSIIIVLFIFYYFQVLFIFELHRPALCLFQLTFHTHISSACRRGCQSHLGSPGCGLRLAGDDHMLTDISRALINGKVFNLPLIRNMWPLLQWNLWDFLESGPFCFLLVQHITMQFVDAKVQCICSGSQPWYWTSLGREAISDFVFRSS